MKQAQTRTTPLISLAFLVSALFSASSFASDSIAQSDTTAEYAQTASTGSQVFAQYGIDEKLIKLSLSSLTAGEHLVEQTTRSIKIGDSERVSRVFLVKETDTKGNIDLRIKYNPSQVDKRDDAIDEIERNTKTEYRLRDYVQSYDPATVHVQTQADETVIISFNYSKYGLPQDIAYFRFMKVAITVKNRVPQKMVITNAKPFSYEGHQIDSYQQAILFEQLENGRVILSEKEIAVKGSSKGQPLEIKAKTVPVALYDEKDGVHVLHQELLSEVSDPRIHEERVELDSLFPLMGDMVRQKGIDLPLPYGFSVAYRQQEMNLPFTDFHIMGVGLNALFDPKKSFGHVNAESLSLRGDINILPFWNLFGVVGKIDVDATVDAHYTGALKETPLGLLCLKEPKLCQPGNVHLPLHLEYDVIGAGTTLSVGYKEFFASLTGTYTTTRLKGNENWGDPIITIQPMLGYQLVDYRAQLFVGAEYQGLKPTISGTIDSVEIGGKPFEYNVGLEMEEWAYLIGFNKQFGKNYNMTFLYNKGETRNSMTLNFGYRF